MIDTDVQIFKMCTLLADMSAVSFTVTSYDMETGSANYDASTTDVCISLCILKCH